MKKSILILATSMMMYANGAMAQHEVGTVTVQPKVGLNIADITDESGADPRIGLAAGLEIEFRVAEKVGISTAMLYSMQGTKLTGVVNGTNVKATLMLDYLNIPIMANLYVAKGLAIKLGIQPAFNLTSKYDVSTMGVSVTGSLSDLGLDIKSFDFAFPIGLSYEFSNVVIDARYNFGVTKLVDNESPKNSVFQFTLGYKFEL